MSETGLICCHTMLVVLSILFILKGRGWTWVERHLLPVGEFRHVRDRPNNVQP